MKNPPIPRTLACLALAFSTALAEPQLPPTRTAPATRTAKEDKIMEATRRAAIQTKLKQIILPSIQFDNVSVAEAIDFLRQRSVELDVTEQDPTKKGVNFVIVAATGKENKEEPGKRMIQDLQLKNIPLGVALKYICELSSLRASIDAYSVTIRP